MLKGGVAKFKSADHAHCLVLSPLLINYTQVLLLLWASVSNLDDKNNDTDHSYKKILSVW